MNPALTEITGRTAQQLVGTKAAAFWHPDDAVGTAADLGRLLRGDLDRCIRERRFVRADGSSRNVNVAVSVVRPPDGEGSPMAIATVEDVTERRQLADDLRQAQQMEALGQLAGGIAHEINTPIQFISDNLSFLSDILGPVLKAVGGSLNAAARLRAGEDPGDVAALLEQIAQDADLDFVAAEAPTALSQSQEGLERVATIVRAMKAFGRPDPSEPRADRHQPPGSRRHHSSWQRDQVRGRRDRRPWRPPDGHVLSWCHQPGRTQPARQCRPRRGRVPGPDR